MPKAPPSTPRRLHRLPPPWHSRWATELQPKEWNQAEHQRRPLVSIGLNIGLSRGGNPVKIERIGRYAIKAIQKQPLALTITLTLTLTLTRYAIKAIQKQPLALTLTLTITRP